uniref:Myosin heavy chain 15 n=1 Tax=Myotis myotis TaxID=51298 RepID=A0A7J7ZYW0_MYOMY|nr:myosin heavy chain 15 [Myotis myotis]
MAIPLQVVRLSDWPQSSGHKLNDNSMCNLILPHDEYVVLTGSMKKNRKVLFSFALSVQHSALFNRKETAVCAIDSLQSSLDSATRSRIEATRLKRNMEGDLNEMELQLSCAIRRVSEATTSLGQLQIEIKDLWVHLDDSTHLNSELKEQVAMAQQRNSLLQSQLEELRSLQEQTECGRRLAEEELLEAMERIHIFHTQVANMSEELKKDQDANAHLEKMRSNMEQTIKDL